MEIYLNRTKRYFELHSLIMLTRMIPQLLLLIFLNEGKSSSPPSKIFPCGDVRCHPEETEVCIETIDEKEKKIEQSCKAGKFWNSCSELGCKYDRCRVLLITTFDGKTETPMVNCDISNQFLIERIFKPKPAYEHSPQSYELWMVLALFSCIIPFLVYCGFRIAVCVFPLKLKEDDSSDADKSELEEMKVCVPLRQLKSDNSTAVDKRELEEMKVCMLLPPDIELKDKNCTCNVFDEEMKVVFDEPETKI